MNAPLKRRRVARARLRVLSPAAPADLRGDSILRNLPARLQRQLPSHSGFSQPATRIIHGCKALAGKAVAYHSIQRATAVARLQSTEVGLQCVCPGQRRCSPATSGNAAAVVAWSLLRRGLCCIQANPPSLPPSPTSQARSRTLLRPFQSPACSTASLSTGTQVTEYFALQTLL